jgi:hypothetical protein
MIEIREVFTQVEEIFHEFGPRTSRPLKRGAVAAVLTNPFAGRFEPNILPMMDLLNPVGLDMSRALIAAMRVLPREVEGYGKGAIVGAAGELEHGALWHVPGGYAMREVLGGAKAIVPSAKKVGAPGTRLDVPVTHTNASYVRSHFDAIEVSIPGAPAADELVYILVMTIGPRVHERVGGLRAAEIKGQDGLR